MQHSTNSTAGPLLWSQPHRARLDFAQGLVKQVASVFRPSVDEIWRKASSEPGLASRSAPKNSEEVGVLLDDAAVVRFMRFMRRKSQDFKWQAQIALEAASAPDLERWLENEDFGFNGTLELNPDLSIPDYYSKGFHHQPDGYAGSPLSGLSYDLGLDISFPTLQSNGVALQVPRADYKRILDLGCGSGRSTEGYATRFSEATVWGIDPSEPMLRLASKRAAERGLGINFRQATAEQTKFPDGHFDLVSATILFHEVPKEGSGRIIGEAFRVLNHGGCLAIGDELPFASMDAYEQWYDRWQTVHNNEPYWEEFKSLDLAKICKDAGFERVEVRTGDRLRHFADLTSGWPPFVLLAWKE